MAPPVWTFSGAGKGCRVRGRAEASQEVLVEALYRDPDGDELSCYNTGLANLEIEVTPEGQPPYTLRSSQSTAMEFGLRGEGWLHGSLPTV